MDPNKAHRLGIDPDECFIESFSGRFAGAWLVRHRERILTSTPSIYQALVWVAALRKASQTPSDPPGKH